MKIMAIADVVVLKDKKLLMVQEGKEICYRQWNLPAGHVDPGENLIKAAIREVREETGYEVKIKGLRRIYNYIAKSGNQSIRFSFIGEIISGDIKVDGKEILDIKWFSLDEIDKMPDEQLRTAKVIRKIIDDIKNKRIYPLDIIDDEL